MKKFLFLLLSFAFSFNAVSQSLYNLNTSPSFKGITIGDPISKYKDRITYNHSSGRQNIYVVNDPSFYSVFNVQMERGGVVEENGKVHAVFLLKEQYKDASGATVFNGNDVLTIAYGLKDKYGAPNVNYDQMSSTPCVTGFGWRTTKYKIEVIYKFYGTFAEQNPAISFVLMENFEDY